MTLDRIGKVLLALSHLRERRLLNCSVKSFSCCSECGAEEDKALAVAQTSHIDVNADKQSTCRAADSTRLSVSKKSAAGTMVKCSTGISSRLHLVRRTKLSHCSTCQFFKRQSKVIRPCILTGGRGCQTHNHCDAALISIPGSRWADPTPSDATGSSEHERCASAPQQSAFHDLAKQRAFQRKMSTVVSPTRKGSSAVVQTTGHRPITAAVSSRTCVMRLWSPP
jgi:hypothetical protein